MVLCYKKILSMSNVAISINNYTKIAKISINNYIKIAKSITGIAQVLQLKPKTTEIKYIGNTENFGFSYRF